MDIFALFIIWKTYYSRLFSTWSRNPTTAQSIIVFFFVEINKLILNTYGNADDFLYPKQFWKRIVRFTLPDGKACCKCIVIKI